MKGSRFFLTLFFSKGPSFLHLHKKTNGNFTSSRKKWSKLVVITLRLTSSQSNFLFFIEGLLQQESSYPTGGIIWGFLPPPRMQSSPPWWHETIFYRLFKVFTGRFRSGFPYWYNHPGWWLLLGCSFKVTLFITGFQILPDKGIPPPKILSLNSGSGILGGNFAQIFSWS